MPEGRKPRWYNFLNPGYPGYKILKMKWTRDRFTVTFADGQTYTEMRDG